MYAEGLTINVATNNENDMVKFQSKLCTTIVLTGTNLLMLISVNYWYLYFNFINVSYWHLYLNFDKCKLFIVIF